MSGFSNISSSPALSRTHSTEPRDFLCISQGLQHKLFSQCPGVENQRGSPELTLTAGQAEKNLQRK